MQDAYLPLLTVAQADRIRLLVRRTLAEHGREATVYGGHARDDQGSTFGLWNVAAACRSHPRGERAWPGVVARHVATLLAHAERSGLGGLTPQEVRSRIYARLYPAADYTGDRWPRHREPVPGLAELLVLHAIAGRSVVPVSKWMVRVAVAGFRNGAGPVSPDVFWWRDGTWAQLSKLQPDGDVVALPNPDLVRLVQQIDRR